MCRIGERNLRNRLWRVFICLEIVIYGYIKIKFYKIYSMMFIEHSLQCFDIIHSRTQRLHFGKARRCRFGVPGVLIIIAGWMWWQESLQNVKGLIDIVNTPSLASIAQFDEMLRPKMMWNMSWSTTGFLFRRTLRGRWIMRIAGVVIKIRRWRRGAHPHRLIFIVVVFLVGWVDHRWGVGDHLQRHACSHRSEVGSNEEREDRYAALLLLFLSVV